MKNKEQIHLIRHFYVTMIHLKHIHRHSLRIEAPLYHFHHKILGLYFYPEEDSCNFAQKFVIYIHTITSY